MLVEKLNDVKAFVSAHMIHKIVDLVTLVVRFWQKFWWWVRGKMKEDNNFFEGPHKYIDRKLFQSNSDTV